jgi:hypothetical protein
MFASPLQTIPDPTSAVVTPAAMDAETLGRWLFAVGKRLGSFQQNIVSTYVWATHRAAQEADVLLRLRGLGVVTGNKAIILARDAGIAPQEAIQFFEGLAKTGLITVHVVGGHIERVEEHIFTEPLAFRAVAKRFDELSPEPAERAMIHALELLSALPVKEDEAIDRLVKAGFQEPDVRKALELQQTFSLMRSQKFTDFGVPLLFNEYLWGHKIEKIGPIIARLPGPDYENLRGLIQEIKGAQGLGMDRLTSAPEHLIKMAAAVGIIETITIQTRSQREQIFTFSPHFYGYRAGPAEAGLLDTSDQVKLFVASIQFGIGYSEDFRLNRPIAFLNKLLNTGSAGDATPIMRDYVLVERQGILAVEATSGTRGRFVLKKRDIVEQAKGVMESGGMLEDLGSNESARFLVTQQSFRTPEANRMLLGRNADAPPAIQSELINAIRDDFQKGHW